MSRMLLHDTTRTVAKSWPRQVVAEGHASGLILCLHNAPSAQRGVHSSAEDRIGAVRQVDGEVFVDACSHADLSQVDAIYETWDLWPKGRRGDWTSDATVDAHVKRVIEIQLQLQAPMLIPWRALDRPDGADADGLLRLLDRVYELSEQALEANPNLTAPSEVRPWVSIPGTPSFWSAGQSLDQFVAALSEKSVAGWYCVPVRESLMWPVKPTSSEIVGLCRSVYSLATWDDVMVGNSDFLGLAAMAAGATRIGTGWDRKQRCFDPRSHAPVAADGGNWLGMVTFGKVALALQAADAAQFFQRDPELAIQLLDGPAVPAAGGARVRHHIRQLHQLCNEVASGRPGPERASSLLAIYGRARRFVDRIEEASGARRLAADWIEPIEQGVESWMREERWPIL